MTRGAHNGQPFPSSRVMKRLLGGHLKVKAPVTHAGSGGCGMGTVHE